jgi:DNA-binding transcriptional regulator YdaS (Cro superfamily)
MTLREYIKQGNTDIVALAAQLGVSEGAVHKWVYGQRTPPLAKALAIVEITGRKVELETLVKPEAA